MAESQASPGSDAGQDTGTDPATVLGDATTSDSVQDASSQGQPREEPDEITRTVSAGGEPAVKMVKHWQRVASEKDSQLAPYKQVEDLFSQLGGGDVARGAEAAKQLLGQYSTIANHPEAREAVQNFLSTGEWKAARPNGNDDYLDDDEPDPIQQNMDALRKEVMELRGQNSVQQMKGYLDSFFGKELADGITLGSILSPEEKSQVVNGISAHVQRLSANDAGQQTLRKLSAGDVQHMLQLQLGPEKWLELGERAHLQKIERKKGAATGVAPQGGTTGNESRSYSGNLTTALEEWAKENNVDLNKIGEL